MVDAELAALVVEALLGRAGRAVDLLGVARVGVHEDELADVVEQCGDQQAVAVRVAGLGGEAVRGALDGDGVEAEALRGGVPRLAALEELEGLGGGGELWTASGERTSTAVTTVPTWPRLGALDAVGEPEDGDHERDVGLDRADDLA